MVYDSTPKFTISITHFLEIRLVIEFGQMFEGCTLDCTLESCELCSFGRVDRVDGGNEFVAVHLAFEVCFEILCGFRGKPAVEILVCHNVNGHVKGQLVGFPGETVIGVAIQVTEECGEGVGVIIVESDLFLVLFLETGQLLVLDSVPKREDCVRRSYLEPSCQKGFETV